MKNTAALLAAIALLTALCWGLNRNYHKANRNQEALILHQLEVPLIRKTITGATVMEVTPEQLEGKAALRVLAPRLAALKQETGETVKPKNVISYTGFTAAKTDTVKLVADSAGQFKFSNGWTTVTAQMVHDTLRELIHTRNQYRVVVQRIRRKPRLYFWRPKPVKVVVYSIAPGEQIDSLIQVVAE